MHETTKLAEARYFLSRLERDSLTRAEFEFELSAFLSSARSVLQYALDEAKSKPGGQSWFDAHARSPEVQFLKQQRDKSIHSEPVKPEQGIAFEDGLSMSCELIGITLTDLDGNVSHGVATPAPAPENIASGTADSARVIYRFTAWPGVEDVVELCQSYLSRVEAIVIEGKGKGLLTA